MKNVLTKICALSSIGLLMLSACNKSGELVKSNGGKAGALTASTTTPVLNKALFNNDSTNVVTFNFTAPNYGYAAVVTNTLQIDIPSDNWANPTSFTLTNKVYSQGFSTPTFNALLLKLNLPAGQAAQISVRIMHSISTYAAPIYSNVLSLTVTPFNLTSWVYVPGAYEGSSWPNPGPLEDSLISATGNGIYTGIINFPSGGSQFLITPAKNWNYKYAATNSPGTGTTETFTTEYSASSGGNFQAPSAGGYYLLTLNTNTNTLTVVPADYYTIIGSAALGWNATGDDTPMKYINDGTGTWLATGVPMIVGEFKFRQDDQWTWSWGPTGTANQCTDTSPTGDGNLQCTTAGTYTLTFVQPATAYGTTPPDPVTGYSAVVK